MTRPVLLVAITVRLLLAGASAQPDVSGLDSLGGAVDSLSDARAADGAALDSLLSAHPDVLARHLALAQAAHPWWQRWSLPALGAGLLTLAGAGAWAYRRLRAQVDAAAMGVASVGAMQAAVRTSVQSAERVDAAMAALNERMDARLADVARTRDGIEAQLAQTRNLLDRAERLGLFQATFAQATAPVSEAPNALPLDPET